MHDALHALPTMPPSLPKPRTLAYAGCRLSYRVLGEGPTVLLIQGVGVHGDAWWPQVELLSERYRCLWFDNRGLGRSQPRGVALSVRQMADDTRALMDAEGWTSAHVVGHSLDGLPIQEAAATTTMLEAHFALAGGGAGGQR